MILTQNQTEELLGIINRNQLVAIGTNLGPDFLSASDQELLMNSGVDYEYMPASDPIFSQFNYGLLSEALGQTAFEALSYEALREYIKMGRYIPLSYAEEMTIQTMKRQTLNDLKTLNGRVFKDVNQILIDNTLKEQQAFIKEEIASGLADKKTISEIAHRIMEKTGDWSRDFERIVAYNSHQAIEEGKAAMILKNNGDKDPIVYKSVFEGACDHCVKAYLTKGIGSQPILFQLSVLKANGTNIGRKTSEWRPTIGSMHPYCFDDQTEVLTDQGYKFFKDLNKEEKFLSVNLQTGDAEWLSAIKWIEHNYKGQMHLFENKGFSLMTSPNHHHVIKTYAKKQLRLVETKELPTMAQFLKHIPNWSGVIPHYIYDNKQYEVKKFTEFLAFFFSEGSTINYNGRLTLHISQSEKKYLQEIFDLCNSLFTNVSKCKDYVQIMCADKRELWNWLSSFGKANEKRIPNQVKESNQELIEIFLQAYCKGDGSFRKGRVWDGHKCADSREYFTSSKLMADDLGELILKIGKCPSYKLKDAQTIFDPKRNKFYTQNQGIWFITECTNKYAYKNTLNEQIVNYDGIIYDVELEKNHTLIVRRNGKVCVSGNCRCALHHWKEGMIWNGKEFVIDIPYVPLRRKIRVWINGKEEMV